MNKALVLSAIGLLALGMEAASFLPDARWAIEQAPPAPMRSEVDEIQAPATRAPGDGDAQALRSEDEIQAPRGRDTRPVG